MSQQQQNPDPWTHSNQSPWSNGNTLIVPRARADVLARSALIFRAHAQLEDAIAAPETPVRQFLIEVARSRLAEKMATTTTCLWRHRLQSWEPVQPTEAKRDKQEKVNALSIENTPTLLPTVPKTTENSAIIKPHRIKLYFLSWTILHLL